MVREKTFTVGKKQKMASPSDSIECNAKTYVIEKKLGEGSYGEVFQVRRMSDGRPFAAKRLKDREDWKAEVKWHKLAVSIGECKAYTPALECIKDMIIVMDLLPPGDTLQDLISQKRITPEGAKRVLQQAKEIRECFMRNGLVHADSIPRNIWVADSGKVMILDWGYACKTRDLKRRLPLDPLIEYPSGSGIQIRPTCDQLQDAQWSATVETVNDYKPQARKRTPSPTFLEPRKVSLTAPEENIDDL